MRSISRWLPVPICTSDNRRRAKLLVSCQHECVAHSIHIFTCKSGSVQNDINVKIVTSSAAVD